MKFYASNALVNINANMKKDGDFDQAMKVAEIMVEQAEGDLAWIEADDCEGRIVLSAKWDNLQAKEWKEMYESAKASA